MKFLRKAVALAVAIVVLTVALSGCAGIVARNASPDTKANQPLKQAVIDKLKAMGSGPERATLVRIFKESSELEVWKETAAGPYKLFATYEICAWSGVLGPKIKEGDRQSPEGFYTITAGLLNKNSSYYLSFDTGFPNKFDRAYGRTGSNLMVHGDCSSRGCYSMTDEAIAEIYGLLRESFKGGNASAQLQIFPFRMTPQNLARHASSPHMSFWKDIKEGYDRFELTKAPPAWDVCNKEYVFDVPRSVAVCGMILSAVPPWNWQIEIRPFFTFGDGDDDSGGDAGLRIRAEARGYLSPGAADRVTVAARLQAGAVFGPGLLQTPRGDLFYSGGGGTVRGQPYQSLGVTLPGDLELGGQAFLAASAEVRLRITDVIGAVAFVDWGQVGGLDFFDDLGGSHAGAGLGLRYDTGFGPIRLDVAAPVSGETGEGVQVYIGIGQAF